MLSVSCTVQACVVLQDGTRWFAQHFKEVLVAKSIISWLNHGIVVGWSGFSISFELHTSISLAPRPWQPQNQRRSSKKSLWGAWVCHKSPPLIGDRTLMKNGRRTGVGLKTGTHQAFDPNWCIKLSNLGQVFSASSKVIFWPHRNDFVFKLGFSTKPHENRQQYSIWLRATSSAAFDRLNPWAARNFGRWKWIHIIRSCHSPFELVKSTDSNHWSEVAQWTVFLIKSSCSAI